MQVVNESKDLFKPDLKCRVCGKALYSTDWGNREITYHCSSPEARFWDFDRGTAEQVKSKKHWDESREEIFFTEEGLQNTA